MNRTSLVLVAAILAVYLFVPACAPDLSVSPGTGGATIPLGQPCLANGQCESGFCADTVCCDAACTQPCQACDRPDSMGVCSDMPVGTDDCPIDGEFCNGTAVCECGVGKPVEDRACPAPWVSMGPGQCQLDCPMASSCGPMEIVCPSGVDCTVWCPGVDSCTGVKVVCPDDTNCGVVCTGPDSCQDLKLQCSPLGPCYLGCGSALGACRNAKMECGLNACEATCEGSEEPTMSTPLGKPCSAQGC